MMVAVAGAIGQALELVAAPAGLQQARKRDFPDDMTSMLRLVAGDAATLEQAVIESNGTEEAIREAAEFFVLQVCFTPGIDSYRVLAVNRDEPLSQIREHYRLLVRWLHPDRNSDAWQTVYLDRVNKAWRDLRDPEARAEYDRLGPDHEDAEAADPVNQMPLGVAAASTLVVGDGKRISARTMRRLPTVVLAGLGICAAVVLALMYADYQAGHQAREALAPARDGPDRRSDHVRSGTAAESISARLPAATTAPPAIAEPDTLPGAVQSDAASTVEPAAGQEIASTGTPRLGASGAGQDEARPFSATAVTAPAPIPAQDRPAPPLMPGDGETAPSPLASAAPETVVPPAAPPAVSAPVEPGRASDPLTQPGATANSEKSIASTPAAINRMDPMPGDTVDRVLEQFRRAYDEGNLIGLMALFTRDARNTAQDSKLLADDYRALFSTSSARTLSLSDMSWWREGEQVVVIARFSAAITPNGRPRARRIGGDIRFELRREDGEVRIARIRHQIQ